MKKKREWTSHSSKGRAANRAFCVVAVEYVEYVQRSARRCRAALRCRAHLPLGRKRRVDHVTEAERGGRRRRWRDRGTGMRSRSLGAVCRSSAAQLGLHHRQCPCTAFIASASSATHYMYRGQGPPRRDPTAQPTDDVSKQRAYAHHPHHLQTTRASYLPLARPTTPPAHHARPERARRRDTSSDAVFG